MWESQRIFRFSSLAKNTIFDMDYFSCFLAQGNVHKWRPTILMILDPHPTYHVRQILTDNILFFFGGGVILNPPTYLKIGRN